MPRPPIPPRSDKSVNCYHQKLSWKISEEDWKSSDERLYFLLETKIPGSSSIPPGDLWAHPSPGGCAYLSKTAIGFLTWWPKEVDRNKISLDAVFTIKLEDGSLVSITCEQIWRKDYTQTKYLGAKKLVKLDPELLYDKERCFTIEAELKVAQMELNEEVKPEKLNVFVKDIGSIFQDLKTSDVTVIAGNEKFHCHKNILSARCEVFKNMLAPNTVESETNTIEVKEVPSEAVESMLKYIYNGEVPEDHKKLSFDLLNASEMYLLDFLKDACLKSLIEKLEVSSCISTFIMADRYGARSGNLRDMVIKFMKCKVEELVETEDWDKLFDNHPALTKEVMKAMAKGSKEKHKCQFCVVSYDK